MSQLSIRYSKWIRSKYPTYFYTIKIDYSYHYKKRVEHAIISYCLCTAIINYAFTQNRPQNDSTIRFAVF